MKYIKLFENLERGEYWKVKCHFDSDPIPYLKLSLKKLKIPKEIREDIIEMTDEIGCSNYIYILHNFEYMASEWSWCGLKTDDIAYSDDYYDKLKDLKYMGEVDITEEIENWQLKQVAKKYNV